MAVALRLDPMLAEAYTSLGLIGAKLFRWREAEKNFRKALELNPNYSNTLLWYSLVLMGRNEIEESAAMVRRAEQIDPLSPLILSNFALRLMEGDYTGALEKANTALEIDPRARFVG